LFLEPRVVRDALARLQRKRESLRHLRRPLAQHVLLRQAVERIVDFYGIELLRVVAEHCVVFQFLRVERAFPLFEGVAAGPCQDLHETMRFDSAFSFLLGFSRARLAFNASIRSSILVSEPGVTSAVMSCPSILR